MRIAFRWCFVYWLIYFADWLPKMIPWGYGYRLVLEVQGPWRNLIVWVGAKVFRTDITIFPCGSGDTTFNYVEVFTIAVIATAATVVWSAVDFRRKCYPLLNDLLRIYLRFAVATIMIGYGLAKVFPGQFPSNEAPRLMQQYGDSSPMGLLWAFMGASAAYTFIGGAAECLGGVLLLFRRTTLMGSLVTLGVMANVAALNFCYDVPVKLFSSHLCLAAIFLAAPDIGRLMKFMVLNRATEPKDLNPVFKNPWLKWGAFAVKMLVVVDLLGFGIYGAYISATTWGGWAPRGPLDGTWMTESFMRDGKDLPAGTDDTKRWRYMGVVQRGQINSLRVAPLSGQHSWFSCVDTPKENGRSGILELRQPIMGQGAQGAQGAQSPPVATWNYEMISDDKLRIQGEYQGAPIEVTLKLGKPSDHLLVNRGFHWINEFPYNR